LPGSSQSVRFAVVQGSFGVLEGLGGEVGVYYAEAEVDPAYRVGELWGGAAFEGESLGAGFEAAAEVTGPAKGGEHDDAALRHRRAEFGGHAEAVGAWTGGVEQGDVGTVVLGRADHVVGAVELGDDLQILFAFQTASEYASAEDLVVDQQQPDAVGQTSLRGTVRAPGKCVREEMSRASVPDHEAPKLTPSISTPHLYQIATRSRPDGIPRRTLRWSRSTTTSQQAGGQLVRERMRLSWVMRVVPRSAGAGMVS
jgi:hypothetical protein